MYSLLSSLSRLLTKRSFGILALALFLSVSAFQPSDAAFAQGSLQLVFHPKNGKSSDQHPQAANLTHLWCQAAVNLENGVAEKVPIRSAKFLHFNLEGHPDKSFPARITDNRAFLDLGERDLFAAGKYRCEITTDNDEFVYGNMFIYMRPVFHVNGSMRLDFANDDNMFEFVSSSVKANKGGIGILDCPTIGYPLPEVRWFKDNIMLQQTERINFVRNQLHIRSVDDEDEGVYRCIASNEFPPAVDFKEVRYEAILDQQLRVTNSLGWIVPLILIIVILILLFVTIYSCAWYKKSRARRYDVSEQEAKLQNAEKQPLQNGDEE